MSSNLKHTTMQHFEWCTELPSIDQPRESPVFFLKNNEWFFKLVYEVSGGYRYLKLYLELKTKHTDFKTCRVNFQVGFKYEENLSLGKGSFQVGAPRQEVWSILRENLQSKLPYDYIMGNWIKLMFCFEDVAVNFFNNPKEVDDKIVQTPLYIDTSFLLEGVSKDLSALLDKGPNHDVEFICGDQTIKAHKNVLSCRSEVFASMLRSEMTEGKTGQVKIQDVEGTIFQQFLRYLYTGVLPELTVDTALQIYEAADKYDVSPLKKQCASFLVEHLSPENACEILIVSDRHSDPDFKKNVMEYVIQENLPFRGETLSNFCRDNPKLAAEVLNLIYQQLPEKNKKS